jgi:nucleolar pre-ribosomal-associated protein 1
MQAWGFAASSNSDSLLSAVASAIDQLLKLLSSNLELREHGLLLGKTLLQQAQLRILSRGVGAPKHKEHIIGPCLRILKEIVTFDGGVLARQLYAKRDLAFDPQTIARCLTYRRPEAEDLEDIVKRPTVRTTAIRYLLANFRFQDDGAKADMLKQSNMLRLLVDGIEGDHPRIISEILQTLVRDVIQDPGIPRRNKSFLFNDRNLLAFCQLYRTNFNQPENDDDTRKPLSEAVHDFMVTACTSPDAGVMRASGWYPPTNDEDGPNLQASTDASIDLGLDGIDWYNKFNKQIPIRNTILGDFILNLRPYAYDMERQLLIAIFEAAPELVAWFYRKMAQSFPFTPKLTATWIGYAAALFETVQLPVPTLFSRMSHLPPPVTIMIESILPGPLDQKTLRQCLVNRSDLIRLFCIRILVASLQKLKDVLNMLKEKASTNGKLWDEAATKLVEEYSRRAPTLQDITKLYNTLRNATGEKTMQREATLRLLAQFHEVLPQMALEENFDVSVPLTNVLQEIEEKMDKTQDGEEEEDGDGGQLALLELSHLVKIASWSSSVHWLAKTKSLKYSPLVTLLRLLARRPDTAHKDIEELVTGILKDGDAIEVATSESRPTGLNQLISSLRLLGAGKGMSQDAVYTFLDKCFHRLSTRPIKYEDDRDALLAKQDVTATPSSASTNLICMVTLEQWPFVQEDKESVGTWIQCFFQLLSETGEILAATVKKEDVLEAARLASFDPLKGTRDDDLADALRQALSANATTVANQPTNQDKTTVQNGVAPSGDIEPTPAIDLSSLAPPPEQESHPVLSRYRKKDLSTLIEDNTLSALVLILTSPHLSLRTQAVQALRSTMSNLLLSTHLERDMLYLLLGSLLETATEHEVTTRPLPGLPVTFAARAVNVLKEPTHVLYPKLNEFLNRGPAWRIRAMPAWWLERVLLHPPSDADTDGSYWREVVWVLSWLVDGLRTNDDFDILRRNGVFEKCMALFFHPELESRRGGRFVELVTDEGVLEREQGLQAKVRPLVLRLVGRAAFVGGATVVVTGMGGLAWLRDVEGVVGEGRGAKGVVEAVRRLILERVDGEKVREWSGGALAPALMDVNRSG